MRLLIIFMLAAASLPAQNLKFKVKQLPKDTSVGRVVLSSLTDSTMTYSDLLKIDNDSLYFNGSGVLTSAMDVGGGTTYNNISETVDTVFIDDRLDIYNPNRTPQLTLSGPRSRFFMINDNGAGDYSQLLFGESETKYADMIWYNDDDKFQIFSYGDIEFSTQYVAPNIIPNLWIDADDGNVGIGTSSPSQKLTLSGPLSRMDFALRDVGSISTQNMFVYDQNSYDNDLDTVDARFAFYLANPNSTNYTGSNDDGPYFYMRGNGSAAERGHIAFVAGNVTNPTGADGRIDFATGSSTKMTIAANGNVGIGTSTPQAPLSVAGSIHLLDVDQTSFADNNFYVYNDSDAASSSGTTDAEFAFFVAKKGSTNTSQGPSFLMRGNDYTRSPNQKGRIAFLAGDGMAKAGQNGTIEFYGTHGISFKTGAYLERMLIEDDGDVVIPQAYSELISGTTRDLYIKDDGTLGYISSTVKSKININPLNDIDFIYDLNPVTFNYRKQDEQGNFTNEYYDKTSYGLIAEEVESVADYMVYYDETEEGNVAVGINYSELITPLLKAIQDQKTEIETLKTLITELSNRLQILENN